MPETADAAMLGVREVNLFSRRHVPMNKNYCHAALELSEVPDLRPWHRGVAGSADIVAGNQARGNCLEIGRNRIHRPAPAVVPPREEEPLRERNPFRRSQVCPPPRKTHIRIAP